MSAPAAKAVAVQWMLLEDLAERVSAALSRTGVEWVIFKGFDVARRFYPRVHDRFSSDLDVLVAGNDFLSARARLEECGLVALGSDPRVHHYQQTEGYCWQASYAGGPLLEIHHALWNLPPTQFAPRVLAAAIPAPHYGAQARVPSPTHALLIACVHAWISPVTQRQRSLEDVRMILQSRATAPEPAAAECHALSLQLPVALAATVVARGGAPEGRRLVDLVVPELRALERWCWRRLLRRGPRAVSPQVVLLARHLSRRPSRLGRRALLRLAWPHPGVVAARTPPHWPWWRRRLHVQAKRAAGLFVGQ